MPDVKLEFLELTAERGGEVQLKRIAGLDGQGAGTRFDTRKLEFFYLRDAQSIPKRNSSSVGASRTCSDHNHVKDRTH